MSLAPQSIELCDICGKLRVDAATKQTIILVHGTVIDFTKENQ